MPDESKRTIYKLISFLLGYPDGDTFWDGIEEVKLCIDALPNSPAKMWLLQTVTEWSDTSPVDLRREYIQMFDFRETTCLYLTAHEYGDSRERGVGLLELHHMYRMAGYETSTPELPDYLPGLFELLSVKPAQLQTEELERRMAQVCHRILDNLGSSSMYNALFCAGLATLPQVTYEGDTITFPKRQQADLDELPYPLNFK